MLRGLQQFNKLSGGARATPLVPEESYISLPLDWPTMCVYTSLANPAPSIVHIQGEFPVYLRWVSTGVISRSSRNTPIKNCFYEIKRLCICRHQPQISHQLNREQLAGSQRPHDFITNFHRPTEWQKQRMLLVIERNWLGRVGSRTSDRQNLCAIKFAKELSPSTRKLTQLHTLGTIVITGIHGLHGLVYLLSIQLFKSWRGAPRKKT